MIDISMYNLSEEMLRYFLDHLDLTAMFMSIGICTFILVSIYMVILFIKEMIILIKAKPKKEVKK